MTFYVTSLTGRRLLAEAARKAAEEKAAAEKAAREEAARVAAEEKAQKAAAEKAAKEEAARIAATHPMAFFPPPLCNLVIGFFPCTLCIFLCSMSSQVRTKFIVCFLCIIESIAAPPNSHLHAPGAGLFLLSVPPGEEV